MYQAATHASAISAASTATCQRRCLLTGRAHGYAGTPTAARTASTTRSCCSSAIPPHIGSARFSAAARSVSGREPSGDAEVAHRGLQVKRRRVVGRARDSRLAERRGDLRPPGRAHDEHVVDVPRLVGRKLDDLTQAELGVACGSLSTRVVPAGEAREEDAQHGGLDGVESRVGPDELERLLVARAVEAQHSHALGHVVVEARHEPTVAQGKEVLGREEAERRADPRLCDSLGAERLRGVLDEREPEPGELGERSRASEEVHRHDRLRPGRDPRGDVLRIEVERRRIDVGEHRRRADPRDRLGRRVERERGADDLVAASDLERLEREDERVGAVRDADRVRHSEERRGLVLERLDLRPEDEASGLEDCGEALLELGDQRRVLRLHVDEWDLLRHAGECSSGEVDLRFVGGLRTPRPGAVFAS